MRQKAALTARRIQPQKLINLDGCEIFQVCVGEPGIYVSTCSKSDPERYISSADCLRLLEQFRDGLSFGQ